ncbi:MAG TPA: aliphatic sulfonate ABC transporter substrate-binding protein [Paraburkholderia sp.]|jgi:sulfonate transport system substrate-binding protein|nr:aliphatic sulfonate ABC transporter substrate-binding protein [Paraburkholderia sp.]
MKLSWFRALRRAPRHAVLLLISLASLASLDTHAATAAVPAEIRVDYAYYSPESLVIKHFGWLEDEFKPDRTSIRWVLSLGSNRALEYLNSGAIDFGSTAGLAAVLGRANGNPIRAVYVYSRPEWTALVVRKDSPIRSIADLKGKKIAATRGTDPFLFTLRALKTAGLSRDDVEIVNLQHPDGRVALAKGEVDAWAGLDPHMAAAQIDDGDRLLYRNVGFNTYGFLNVREAFASQYPQAVVRVLKVYEKARAWIVAHPDDTATILADESRVSLPVAKLQLARNDFSDPLPGDTQRAALKAAAPILTDEQLVKPGVDPAKVVDELIDPVFARPLVAASR